MSSIEGAVTLGFLEQISGRQLPRRRDGSIDMAKIHRDNAMQRIADRLGGNPFHIIPRDDIMEEGELIGTCDYIGNQASEDLYTRAATDIDDVTVEIKYLVLPPDDPRTLKGADAIVRWETPEAATEFWGSFEELAAAAVETREW